jgi:ABC-type dipeptide/oligopeptide/nickel transport system permease component
MRKLIIFLIILIFICAFIGGLILGSLILAEMDQMHAQHEQTQADIAQMRQQIAQQKADDSLQHQTLQARIDYLTHPAIASERAVEWIMGRGEFGK